VKLAELSGTKHRTSACESKKINELERNRKYENINKFI
jgi:hypothetical protein